MRRRDDEGLIPVLERTTLDPAPSCYLSFQADLQASFPAQPLRQPPIARCTSGTGTASGGRTHLVGPLLDAEVQISASYRMPHAACHEIEQPLTAHPEHQSPANPPTLILRRAYLKPGSTIRAAVLHSPSPSAVVLFFSLFTICGEAPVVNSLQTMAYAPSWPFDRGDEGPDEVTSPEGWASSFLPESIMSYSTSWMDENIDSWEVGPSTNPVLLAAELYGPRSIPVDDSNSPMQQL